MTDPSQLPPATDNSLTDSQGALDATAPRADAEVSGGTQPEPNFAPPLHAGEVGTFGRYRVLKKLGQGGMGAVYLGYDSTLERKVALKVMLPQYAANRAARDRFLREARSAAKVKSDHVVTIHDVGEPDGVPFIAMEYLLGYPLDQYLRTKGELPLAQVLRVARETALGLSAAHALGLVHRDIKPANLWLEAPNGRVKLLDFGLARPTDDDAHLTNSGAVMGTPAYMSPEQARGNKVDHRSDLFSLGVMLYRLAAGKMPFAGATTMAVLTSLAVDTPTPVRELNPQLPEALGAVIAKLLAKDAADRFQTAKEVVAALVDIEHAKTNSLLPVVVALPMAVGAQTQNVWDGIDASESVAVPLASSADTDTPPVPAPKPPRAKPERKASKRPLILAGAGLLVACAVLAAVILQPWKKKPDDAQADSGEKPTPTPVVKEPPPPVVKDPPTVVVAADPDRAVAEYALSLGGTVKVNGQNVTIKAAADLPKDRLVLTAAYLSSNKNLTDVGLANFKECKGLTQLYLNGTPVTDAGLAHLKECKALTYLNLLKTEVTAKGLDELHAAVPGCRITWDGGIIEPTVTANPDRKAAEYVLSLGGIVKVNGDEKQIKTVAELPKTPFMLKGVIIAGQDVTDDGLINLRGCKSIEELWLANSQVGNAGLAHLKDLKVVEYLNLNKTLVTEAGLVHLAGYEKLGQLWLQETKVSEASVKKLAEQLPKCQIRWDGGTIGPKK